MTHAIHPVPENFLDQSVVDAIRDDAGHTCLALSHLPLWKPVPSPSACLQAPLCGPKPTFYTLFCQNSCYQAAGLVGGRNKTLYSSRTKNVCLFVLMLDGLTLQTHLKSPVSRLESLRE